MYRLVHGNSSQEPDVQDFLNLLNDPDPHSYSFFNGLFEPNTDLIVTRAPGRLDVMGGIADYSGSHVLEYPIAEATFAAMQLATRRRLHVVTLLEDEPEAFSIPLSTLDGPMEYGAARARYGGDAPDRWMSYVVGVFLVLMRELNVSFDAGANILISSRVPPGKGVSSSAAL